MYVKTENGYAPYVPPVEGEKPADPVQGSGKVEFLVTPEDEKRAKQDTYTSRLMGKHTPTFYAAGFRPTISGDKVLYTTGQQVYDLGPGRGRLGFVEGQGGMDLVEYTPDGQVKYFEGDGGVYRGLKPDQVMEILNKNATFRYNQVADKLNETQADSISFTNSNK